MQELTCFKTYDIRGRVGVDLDPAIAKRIGRAFCEVLAARRVVVGRDCRESSGPLAEALIEGLLESGAEVLDIGLAGTEEMYHATHHFGADGGIEVTASHNPIDYNGMKLVGPHATPIDPDRTLGAVRRLAESGEFAAPQRGGVRRDATHARAAYVQTVMKFVDPAALRPLTILVNSGNGVAGPAFDAVAVELEAHGAPLRFVRMHHDPDGSFPNGIPNPLLPENQPITANAVRAHGADMGVAWDGDFDRCFFFDADGQFIDGEYILGLLAAVFLEKHPGEQIVHDPRVVLNTLDVVAKAGGRAVLSATGHVFIKQKMRETGAVYGGEMSAHHYFRDFAYCDSGMIPWLLVAELMGRSGTSLADLVADRRARFPSSGEINFRLSDPVAAMAAVRAAYAPGALMVEDMDGMSLTFEDWRFNLRASNTEPVVRLNVEAKGNAARVAEGVAGIRSVLAGFAAP
ncbi:phosphomannomutase [Phaeovulum sp.]|uniref:phosphomannomutase n=1 Tax=Phaeovulum sp. TaxID=2934796 RepID=UPI0039E5A0FE